MKAELEAGGILMQKPRRIRLASLEDIRYHMTRQVGMNLMRKTHEKTHAYDKHYSVLIN